MKLNQSALNENLKLLTEIRDLKMKMQKLYLEKGPSTPDYIRLSLKLNFLMNEYFDEKLVHLQ
ncbi:Spo0E family sporulation regulatory protein-aspartic acid phosphatase [Neobacillus niacini]|uniref:Spo0E family sporulation regulatory protein-aspartic acid phosphatase n=1 Tax=Neobacillus niacini TaxID=86668 RepID=UPI002855A68C|nr:Spo0E family sporulation regulatory protein-aspartic acid phosphatase [Neobacillus niacini]MDR6998932.1 hypothetical protein [Neobacillus niacini]